MNIKTIKEAMTVYEPEGFYDWMAGYVAALSEPDDGWIKHDGSCQPVSDDTIVEVRFERYPSHEERLARAFTWGSRWKWSAKDSWSITSYRVVR